MMLVAAVEDFDDAHRAHPSVMTTQTAPRRQLGLSEGFVPAAGERLDLLGRRDKYAPGKVASAAAGSEHRLTSSSVLARRQGRGA